MLYIHIILGHLALVSGLIALISPKGKRIHVLGGRIFFYSMLSVGLSGVWLSLKANNIFLLLISTFVLYQVINGFLAVRDKSLRLRWYSPILLLLGLFTSILMFLSRHPVLISFGCIQVFILMQDIRMTVRVLKKEHIPTPLAMIRHIGQMTGAYIGATTAFLVVNVDFFSKQWQVVIWLAPTLVFTPFLIYWIRRMRLALPRKSVAVFVFVFLAGSLSAQPFAEKKSRHRFAQMYTGLFSDYQNLGSNTRAGINIGGLHFWGHADFRVEIPIWRQDQEGLLPGVSCEFKYYPWAIKENQLKPFLGFGWQPTTYKEGAGPGITKHQFPLLTGLTYNYQSWLLELKFAYHPRESWDYPVNPQNLETRSIDAFRLGISVNYYFDVTLSAEESWENGRTAFYTDTLGKLNRLNSWSFGLGMSSAFFIARYSPDSTSVDLLHPDAIGLVPDIALGYYWHRTNVQLQTSYRFFSSKRSAYQDELHYQRHSLALEAYKFAGDYHGFVPFFGGGISYNWLKREYKGTTASKNNRSALLPHLTLGWDIRPNRLQSFYLRTNVRYTFPSGALQENRWPLANLEVNFIQLVLLIDRF